MTADGHFQVPQPTNEPVRAHTTLQTVVQTLSRFPMRPHTRYAGMCFVLRVMELARDDARSLSPVVLAGFPHAATMYKRQISCD